MTRVSLTVLALLFLAAPAWAGPGGKLKFKDNHDVGVQESGLLGRVLCLYFTKRGDQECTTLDNGSFSDKNVIEASRQLVLVMIDCSNPSASKELMDKYAVSHLPRVLFVAPGGGEVIGRLPRYNAKSVTAAFTEMNEKHAKTAPWKATMEEGIKEGKAQKKPVLIFFHDQKKNSIVTEAAFLDPDVKTVSEKFVLVRFELDKKNKTCKDYKARTAPMLVIIDPHAQLPHEKPITTVKGKRDPKGLKRSLESALKKWGEYREDAPKKERK